MAVLVTGGAGFIGSHVAEALVARGEDVVVLDDLSSGKRENLPDGVELVEGDVREPQDELFAGVKPTHCYHLAAQIDVRVSVARPDHDAQINVLGTVNLLQASLEHGTQIVFSSTGGAIYGECERPRARGCAAPARSRRTGRRSSRRRSTWRRTTGSTGHGTSRCGTETCTARGRTRTARLGSSRSSSARCSQNEAPKVFGDGAQTRDYVYVGDVARATPGRSRARRRRLQRRARGARHRSSSCSSCASELRGRASTRRSCRRVRARSSAPSSIRAAPWTSSAGEPEHSLEDGLRETYEFFRG